MNPQNREERYLCVSVAPIMDWIIWLGYRLSAMHIVLEQMDWLLVLADMCHPLSVGQWSSS